jgi:hypothetical protein
MTGVPLELDFVFCQTDFRQMKRWQWKTVSRSIITLLEDQYEHLDAKDSELMVEMFMIGRKAACSVPTILFCCEGQITSPEG